MPSKTVRNIIDSHHHLWDLTTKLDYAWLETAPSILNRSYVATDLEKVCSENNVTQTVAVQAHDSLDEVEWLLGLTNDHPLISGIVAWVDIFGDDLPKVLHELSSHPKVKGIRLPLQGEPDSNWLLQDSIVNGLKELTSLELSFDVLSKPHHLKSIPALAEKIPDLKLVINHISKPLIASGQLDPWADDISAVASIPGAYCKISGMVTEADHNEWTSEDLKPYVYHVVNKFGFDRVMFGSDWPVCLIAATYTEVVTSTLEAVGPIDSDDQQRLLNTTAKTFYRLDD